MYKRLKNHSMQCRAGTGEMDVSCLPVDCMQQTLLSYSDLQNARHYHTFCTAVPLLQCSPQQLLLSLCYELWHSDFDLSGSKADKELALDLKSVSVCINGGQREQPFVTARFTCTVLASIVQQASDASSTSASNGPFSMSTAQKSDG